MRWRLILFGVIVALGFLGGFLYATLSKTVVPTIKEQRAAAPTRKVPSSWRFDKYSTGHSQHVVNRALQCNDCHTSNAQAVPWPFPAYAPDCAACHASDYRPGPHRNASVSQLRDCAGSCHQSSPEHSVNSREW